MHAPRHAPVRSCTCPFLRTLSESLVSWHSSPFGRLCCITSIYSRVARIIMIKPVDTSEVAKAALTRRLSWPQISAE
jgi:hypothetical protein